MAGTVDERTRANLGVYLRGVRTLPKGPNRRRRFGALLGELFPGQKMLTQPRAGDFGQQPIRGKPATAE
jgi:hypothetical protein